MRISGRGHHRFSAAAMLFGISLAVVFGSSAPAAQTATAPSAPARAAFEECGVLFTMAVFNQAIARCDEAVRLDPKFPNPYMMLGSAHDALSQQAPTSAPPDDAPIPEHRRKAYENYKKFLALTSADTELRRPTRPMALGALLGIYISGEPKDEAALEYANELAKEPSLSRRDLLALAGTYLRHERPDLSEQAVKRQLEADPSDVGSCRSLAQIYLEMPGWTDGPRFEDRIGSLERCAARRSDDPAAYHQLAVLFWDKTFRDPTLADQQKLALAERGLAHASRALALDNDFIEALVFKGLLLRMKASTVSDPVLTLRLIEEAEVLQKRALALKTARVSPRTGPASGVGPPPPPPVPAPAGEIGGVTAGIPAGAIRVGGDIPAPRKLKDVSPEYPAIAIQSRLQGVVILECIIDPEGKVVEAKVLRSIPLLDQAAIDAVRQWIFTRTLLNGVPVPVIMTVTVNFKQG